MDYTGAFKHFSLRLKERFNEDITYDEYVKNFIFKRTLPKKYNGKKVLYQIGYKVCVYAINKKFEVPITVYKLDRFNKGRILKSFN
jgi:hypothetical protein